MQAKKLILLLKTCLFIGLTMFIGKVYAEFYMVYSMPPSGCGYRSSLHYRVHHHARHHRIRAKRSFGSHRHYVSRSRYQRPPSGLYILFPLPGGGFPCPDMWPISPCDNCCTPVTWQSGSYAVYTLPPDGIASSYIPDGSIIDEDPTINPDLSTADDVFDNPGMYVN